MEIYVTDLQSLPHDSIISIRNNGTRRQANADVLRDKSLKFTTSIENCSDPLKIDIMLPVASGDLVLQGRAMNYELNMATTTGEPALLGLAVKNLPEAAVGSPRGESPRSAKTPKAAARTGGAEDSMANAREYLEHHGLLKYVQNLLHAVITLRPDDPYSFMQQQFGALRPEKARVSKVAEPQPEPEATPTPTPPSTSREAHGVEAFFQPVPECAIPESTVVISADPRRPSTEWACASYEAHGRTAPQPIPAVPTDAAVPAPVGGGDVLSQAYGRLLSARRTGALGNAVASFVEASPADLATLAGAAPEVVASLGDWPPSVVAALCRASHKDAPPTVLQEASPAPPMPQAAEALAPAPRPDAGRNDAGEDTFEAHMQAMASTLAWADRLVSTLKDCPQDGFVLGMVHVVLDGVHRSETEPTASDIGEAEPIVSDMELFSGPRTCPPASLPHRCPADATADISLPSPAAAAPTPPAPAATARSVAANGAEGLTSASDVFPGGPQLAAGGGKGRADGPFDMSEPYSRCSTEFQRISDGISAAKQDWNQLNDMLSVVNTDIATLQKKRDRIVGDG